MFIVLPRSFAENARKIPTGKVDVGCGTRSQMLNVKVSS